MTTATTENTNTGNESPNNARDAFYTDSSEKPTNNANSFFVPPTKEPEAPATPEEGKKEEDSSKLQGEAKRYFDLKKHHDKTVTELREEKRKLEEQLSQIKSKSELPKSEEELELFKEKNPDLYDTIIALARKQAQAEDEAVKTKLEEIQRQEDSIKMEKAESAIRQVHPDLDDLRMSDDFHTWAETVASKRTQEAIYNNPFDAKAAIEAIDLYKLWKERNSKQESPRSSTANNADAASLITTRTNQAGGQQKKVWTKEDIKNMSLEDYEKYKSEILSQLRGQ